MFDSHKPNISVADSDQELLMGKGEHKKRKREYGLIGILAGLFVLLSWIEIQLFDFSESLPFVHSIFFIGLVNFNIILFLLLIFFIFRNLVKVFTERRDGIFGGSLKGKLIAAFVSFSVIPTLLMFVISVFYINNSFDKWFSEKMSGVLKSSLEVTNEYFSNAKIRNYHFARLISEAADKVSKVDERFLRRQLSQFRLDAVEYYPDVLEARVFYLSKEKSLPYLPEVSIELLKKGIFDKLEASTVHHFGDGNLIRVIVPSDRGAFVVSTFVPLSLISKIENIASAYQDFKNINPIEYPIKAIYLILLILMTLVILLGATWFGFYLARQLSVPLQILGQASRKVAQGDYQSVKLTTGSDEMNELIANFNHMTGALEASESEIKEANFVLRKTLSQLDERTRYLGVVLENVSTGVISVDEKGIITTVNRQAERLLKVTESELLGLKAEEVLQAEYFETFTSMIRSMKESSSGRLQKEVTLRVGDRQIPINMTVSLLKDEDGKALGNVIVFDDMSDVVRAQRAAAWTEVARRIAHEIKNPLTPIKLSAQRLRKKFAGEIKDPAFYDCTNMIIEQVDDLKLLVNEFSQYARLPEIRPVVSDLSRVIGQCLDLFKFSEKQITIVYDPDRSLPEFLFDPDQIKRVITNLIDNAIAAVKDEAERKIEIKTQFNSSLKLVVLTISDSGKGVPLGIRDRLFEPYVTTKTDGTGLGLAIVKRAVEDHNGYIRALKNKPKGTKMLIELPVLVTEPITHTNDYKDKSQQEGWV